MIQIFNTTLNILGNNQIISFNQWENLIFKF